MPSSRPASARHRRLTRHWLLALALALPAGQAGADEPVWMAGLRAGDGNAVIPFKEDVHTLDAFVRRGMPALTDRLSPWLPAGASLHLEASVSRVRVEDEAGTVVALGPVLTLESANGRYWLSLGGQPGYISDFQMPPKQLGGRFQFTSHVAVGVTFAGHYRLGLRLHHTSNAHLYPDNDGIDAQSIEGTVIF